MPKKIYKIQSPDISSLNHIEKYYGKGFNFIYYSEKTFENIKKENAEHLEEVMKTIPNYESERKEIKVIGSVYINKKIQDTKEEKDYLQIKKEKPDTKSDVFFFEVKETIKNSCIGYVQISEFEYIQILKTKSLIILLFPLLIVGLLLLFFFKKDLINPVVPEETYAQIGTDSSAEDWDGTYEQTIEEINLVQENTTIPGYTNLQITEKTKYVTLINPPENTVNFVYTIYLDEKAIYTTNTALEPGKIENAIAPGKSKDVDFKKLFPTPGVYQVVFVISAYDTITNAPCNGSDMIVKVTVN